MKKKIKLKGQVSIEVLIILGILIIGGIILGSFYLNNINKKTQEATDISSTSNSFSDFLNDTGDMGTPNYDDFGCDSNDDCSIHEDNECILDYCNENGNCVGTLLTSGNCTTSLNNPGTCVNGVCVANSSECNPYLEFNQCGDTSNDCTIYECSIEGTCVEKNLTNGVSCSFGFCIDGECVSDFDCVQLSDCSNDFCVPNPCYKWNCEEGRCVEKKLVDGTYCIIKSDPSEDGYCLGGDCRPFDNTCQNNSDCISLGSELGDCQEAYCKIISGQTTGVCDIRNITGICCGNAICEDGENYSNCLEDCSCGDLVCDDLERANGTCPDDCGLLACLNITNDICQSSISYCSICHNDPYALNCSPCCGDGVCNFGEEGICNIDCDNGGIFSFELSVNPLNSSALLNNNFLITVNGEGVDTYNLNLNVINSITSNPTNNCCLVGNSCNSSYSLGDVSSGDHTYQFNCNSEGIYKFEFTGTPSVGDPDFEISTWDISNNITPNYAFCKKVINSNGEIYVCINKLEGEDISSYGSLKVYINHPDIFERYSLSPSCVTNTNGSLCVFIGKTTP
ncbi:MAG: hypothetical protein PHR26_02780 [Candidatus ainarchaeum sp.]|nr:hypothetical protein [Candidatus ainarchaeum sp.]